MPNFMTEDEVAQINWCDVSLCEILWINEGRDVVVGLLFPPSDRKTQVAFRWARGLRMSIEISADVGGYPMTWNAQVTREDRAWSVAFDFADEGHLSFVCQDLEMLTPKSSVDIGTSDD